MDGKKKAKMIKVFIRRLSDRLKAIMQFMRGPQIQGEDKFSLD